MKKLATLILIVLLLTCMLASCEGIFNKDKLFDGKTPKDLYGSSVNKYKNNKDSGLPYLINIAWSKKDAEPSVVIDLVCSGNSIKYTITEGNSTEEITYHDGVMYFKDKNGGKHHYESNLDMVTKYLYEHSRLKDFIPAFPENIPNSWFDDLEFVPSEDGEYYTVTAEPKKGNKNHPLYEEFYKSDVICKLYFTKDGILDKIELENVTVNGEISDLVISLSWSENIKTNAPVDKDDYHDKGDFDPDKGHKPGDDNRPAEDKHTHKPGEIIIENEVKATCTTDGGYDEVVYCSDDACGMEISRNTVIITAEGHTYETEVIREHTMDSMGLAVHTCIKCSDSYEESIDHNYSPTNIVQPTCYSEGYTEYACSCGRTIVRDVTPSIGHIPGEKEYVVNEVGICECEWSNPYIIRCTDCGVICEEGADGAYGHVYTTWETCLREEWIPECEQAVLERAECDNCTCHPYIKVLVPAPGHDWTDWTRAVLDDGLLECENPIYYVRFCKNCDLQEVEKRAPAPGHNYVDGSCTVCGQKNPDYVGDETEHEHSFGEWVKAEPHPDLCPCVAENVYIRVCSCGFMDTKTEPPAGHVWGEWEPTITNPSVPACQLNPVYLRECVECNCNNCIDTKEEPAPGHSYTDGKCIYCGEAEEIHNHDSL